MEVDECVDEKENSGHAITHYLSEKRRKNSEYEMV